MKTSRKYFLLFFFKSRTLTYAGVIIQRDENENRSKTISIPKRLDFPSSSTKRNQPVSLYDKAFQLTGDTPFSRKLEEEALKEEQHRLAVQENNGASSSNILFSSLFVPIILAVTKYGFATTIQALSLAWLPVLLFTATWIEILSIALLLVQPPIWSFLVNDFFSGTWTIMKKLLLSELWRHFWKHVTFPNLSPPAAYLELTPHWMQAFCRHANKLVSKHVHGLLRKSFQESLGIVVGAIFESLVERGRNRWVLEHHEVSMNAFSGHEVNLQADIGSCVPSEEVS